MKSGVRQGCLVAGVIVSGMSTLHMAIAEEEIPWDFTPHIGVTQIYTDNVGLSRAGEEENEYITQTDVGFMLQREGSRAAAELAYNLQNLSYWRETRRNSTYHQFSGNGNVELLEDRFFIDASSSYSQRFQSRRDNVTQDNINDLGERRDVLTFHVSPNYIQRMGDVATGQLRYTHDRVDYQDASTSSFDSETNQVLARIENGRMFSRVGWELSYRRSETEYDDGSSVTFQTAEALLRWFVTRRLNLFVAGGEEDNEFVQDARRARPDDTFWRAGAGWQSTRTDMDVFYGERFFGETYGASLNHRFRNSQLSMEYTEGLTTVSHFEIERRVFPVLDSAGNPLIVNGQPLFLELEYPDLQSGVYLSRRFSLGLSGERHKLTWSVRGFDERREFEVNDQRERVRGLGTNFALRIAAHTQFLLNGSAQNSTYQEDDREDDYYVLGTGIRRDLGPRTSATLNYRYAERNSNQPENEFQENRVSLSFRKSF
ncbi:TIGR03016 family PEP-CTERM system-associated outer membrane protein [Thiohalophilus thiocyanatoxydans]|uniref:Uncharacterized protein (PEP-CTERM system associated) n=1 Tax=Thiohalophilus thiocyanatoxydans TaxID=381308 RepID=A0A4R8IWA5_9GAMM|nr:TIGR03016 family PEP-CTERM system-associated outer membrane protein [Thiohalophilus thiocyanatoxydans]TDY03780.1 uncharacterized protein (PEP-CTERM system associated) [Thiohalophilus thiocyanatoxydans]